MMVKVPGGVCLHSNVFSKDWLSYAQDAALAVADPPYGDNIVSDNWDSITAKELAVELTKTAKRLSHKMLPGSHLCIWGGFGTPKERALFRTILYLEEVTPWRMAEFITWKKKRAYGTSWRCLAAREEMARFVLGDIKKPRVFNPPYTDQKRGYLGFNKKYPAKSDFKRMTMVWDHASDMTRNKPYKCLKPEPLARTEIEMCTRPGDLVLDLFAGSAELSLTARKLNRSFVCVEADKAEFDKLVERLRG